MIRFCMGKVGRIVRTDKRRFDITWRLNVVASREKHLLQSPRVYALIQVQV